MECYDIVYQWKILIIISIEAVKANRPDITFALAFEDIGAGEIDEPLRGGMLVDGVDEGDSFGADGMWRLCLGESEGLILLVGGCGWIVGGVAAGGIGRTPGLVGAARGGAVVDGTEGVVGGGDSGTASGGGVVLGSVLISSFMPVMQCPDVWQMKYLVPGVSRGMTAEPPLKGVCKGLVNVQES